MKVFPTCLFAPDGQEADIERRVTSGGVALSGDEDVIASDGGGRVFYEIADPYLDEPETALAYRAVSAYLDGGVRAIIVPFCDARHQPTSGLGSVPHSDDTPFGDEGEYSTQDGAGTVASAALLRATTIVINLIDLPRAPVGGEWLSIDHPAMRWRAYRIAEIIAQSPTQVTLSIRPPLREAITVGQAVDFASPRCTMRLDPNTPMRSPTMMGFADGGAFRFVEDFTGSYA